ncbi:Uncharacterized protein APZ42_000929, partial [Daphnia magna]
YLTPTTVLQMGENICVSVDTAFLPPTQIQLSFVYKVLVQQYQMLQLLQHQQCPHQGQVQLQINKIFLF